MIISINKADYIGEYKIKLYFSDGLERVIDFYNFLNVARNPMTKKYLNKDLFKNYTLSHGDIIWNDYELCFPVWDLHEGKL